MPRLAALVPLLGLCLCSCWDKSWCQPGYDEGDRFRITIAEHEKDSGHCGVLSLGPGSTFDLTAGEKVEDRVEPGCFFRPAMPPGDDFAPGILSDCMPGTDQLAFTCRAELPNGCVGTAELSVGGAIDKDTPVLESVLMVVDYDGLSCRPQYYCGDRFLVRVETLGK